jgi:dTDP-4-amino-4,6-dideoxygalactose transaminase
LHAQYSKIREEVRQAIDEVADSQHLQNCFADLGYKKGDFPRSELVARQVLALPLYPELTAKQQEMVVEQVQAFYRS